MTDRNGGIVAGTGQQRLTMTYTLPPSEGDSTAPMLVSLGKDGAPTNLEVNGNTLVFEYEDNSVPLNDTQVQYFGKVTVNGTVIVEYNQIGPYGADGGPAGVLLRPPLIVSTTPGLYTVDQHYVGNNEVSRTDTYIQRKLLFEGEFPQYDPESTDPIEIRNTVAWSDGAPPTNVSWTVENEDGSEKRGQGPDIEATWTPPDRVLAQAEDNPDDAEYERVPFTVTASAPSFPSVLAAPARYEISNNFDLSGIVKIKIVNGRVEPEPFTEENSTATVKADIVLIDLDTPEEEVTWTVSLLDSAGKEVLTSFATGSGYQVTAAWDGLIAWEGDLDLPRDGEKGPPVGLDEDDKVIIP